MDFWVVFAKLLTVVCLVVIAAGLSGLGYAYRIAYRRERRGKWNCTRCGRSAEDAKVEGCFFGPCPMGLRDDL